MVRRYQYHNPHDASPHYGMLKCLIGLAVLLCIWNVWTSGAPDTDTTSYTARNSKTYSYNSNDGRMIRNLGEKEKDQKRRSKQQYKTSYSTYLNDGRSTVEDPYLKVSSSGEPLVKNNQLQSIPMTEMSGHRLILIPLTAIHELQQGEGIHSTIGLQVQQQQQINHSLRNAPIVPHPFPVVSAIDHRHKTNILPSNGELSEQLSSNDIHLVQPVQTHSRLRSSSSSSSSSLPRNNSMSSSYTQNSRRHLHWSHFIYAVVVSCSLLAGGIFARRALERIDRWEQLCKEDSLAFDIAYTSMTTDTYSDVSYGSAGSISSTDWSGDYLDRFDV